jgi:formate hydrogenlyase transcriptional activator
LADRIGRFELADRGTLFLDEIGELELDLQAKLLHVLQDGEFQRIGGTQTMRVDVRMIAATNRDLDAAVANGTFRADLYYRLSVFPVNLPPLRDRREDIPLLVWHFINKKQRALGKEILEVPHEMMNTLVQYDWPGNVRELENVIERAMILTSGSILMLNETLGRWGKPHRPALPATSVAPETPAGTNKSLEEISRAHILSVLDQCDWKIKGAGNAAERLGMKASTLRYRMNKLGIRRTVKPR